MIDEKRVVFRSVAQPLDAADAVNTEDSEHDWGRNAQLSLAAAPGERVILSGVLLSHVQATRQFS